MAEQEVAKHVKKTYKIWTSNEHSFWHKLKEFVVEIFIIVFAVTLSIKFHDYSEHSHEQKDVKDFMLGLKTDLLSDITEMEGDKVSFRKTEFAFKYITSVKLNKTLNSDSLNSYNHWISNTTGLIPNNGRFEGFKSAGKIGNIENKELQNDILDLYQEDIPSLLTGSDFYTEKKKALFVFIGKNKKRITDSTSNLNVILSSDEGQNLCSNLVYTGEIRDRYNKCILKSKKIIKEIDEEYNKN
ncbi:MAG TPA: hypothetical protein VGN20_03690 [Mucilaginibacter sp.]|jgi:hypothetical protein